MRIDGLKIEHSEHRSGIEFFCDGKKYVLNYTRLLHEKSPSIDSARLLLDYIDELVQQKMFWQEKYSELLSKYDGLLDEKLKRIEELTKKRETAARSMVDEKTEKNDRQK